MHILQTSLFERTTKKFVKQLKLELDNQIQSLVKDPQLGVQKKGDLAGVRVYKFRFKNQEYLLSYKIISNTSLQLISIGSHENFYRDLKNYL